ncbi:MAG: hypothetical protein AAGA18_01800 [Verrucomicrobiota bacterium]
MNWITKKLLFKGLFLLAIIFLTQKIFAQDPYTPLQLQFIKNQMISQLDTLGYDVLEGMLSYLSPEESEALCAQFGWNCQANNPTTPYGLFLFPHQGDDSYQAMHWKLAKNEAVVFVGVTPPKCRYYGIVPYIWSRYEDGNEINLFASLGDTYNNGTMNTSGPNYDTFSKNSVIIMTRDWDTDTAIRQALTHPDIGLSPNIFNTYGLPITPALRMGYIRNVSDNFAAFTRLALFEDEEVGQSYMDNPPAFIMKVRPKNRFRATVPLGQPILRPAGSGKREQDMMINGYSLQEALESLEQGIRDYYAPQIPTEMPLRIDDIFGFECIEGIPPDIPPFRCLFDNRDTIYNHHLFDPVLLPDEPSTFFMVYGINHAKTGKVTYHNVSINEFGTDRGVVSIDDRFFDGSANKYTDHPLKDYLYAMRISRTCSDEDAPFCYQVSSDPESGITLERSLYVMFRYYLELTTGTRPAEDEIISDRVLLFD